MAKKEKKYQHRRLKTEQDTPNQKLEMISGDLVG